MCHDAHRGVGIAFLGQAAPWHLTYRDIGSVYCGKFYCSQRTLERSFQRVTALPLKQCQSMNRLEKMLEYVYQRDSAELDWVDVALKFGFSEQPHLIRYLKKQLGFTPKTYEKERGLTIDAYGGVRSNSL
ncbi:helix-turn-helix domain-containing protein [Shewanella sp. 0m-11]